MRCSRLNIVADGIVRARHVVFCRMDEARIKGGAGGLAVRPIYSLDMNQKERHYLMVARMFREVQGLRIYGADGSERLRQTTISCVTVQCTIHRAVNSQAAPSGNDERTVAQSL